MLSASLLTDIVIPRLPRCSARIRRAHRTRFDPMRGLAQGCTQRSKLHSNDNTSQHKPLGDTCV
ncbi:hypothetical protein J8I87_34660 [Paraburkholderia sp. LEh10]|uniref:hypothetical protein n=1 Tax=Paraburkholderia sp. LEh10 TaxID=2821353 RepID=UPI001AE7038D|nr:hypothetical protein [Paraburkholderia sp. LEh10]MBP0594718.1 hypothetical protein [Paraburkholderia sp. LEh10]